MRKSLTALFIIVILGCMSVKIYDHYHISHTQEVTLKKGEWACVDSQGNMAVIPGTQVIPQEPDEDGPLLNPIPSHQIFYKEKKIIVPKGFKGSISVSDDYWSVNNLTDNRLVISLPETGKLYFADISDELDSDYVFDMDSDGTFHNLCKDGKVPVWVGEGKAAFKCGFALSTPSKPDPEDDDPDAVVVPTYRAQK